MQKFYIDSIKGNDNHIDRGTMKFPYATITKCLTEHTISEDTELIISDGEYEINTLIVTNLNENTTLRLIGNGKSTTISIIANICNLGKKTSMIEFCRLSFTNKKLPDTESSSYFQFYQIIPHVKLCFYNVYFADMKYPSSNTNTSYATFFNKNNELHFKNCFIPRNAYNFSTTYAYAIFGIGAYMYPFTVENSYGDIAINKAKDADFALINTYNGEVNADDDYRIKDDIHNLLEMGLYYGEYAWDFFNFILSMDGQYYGIKKELYNSDLKMFTPITESDILNNGFETYSISNMKELFKEITIEEETFKPIDKFDNFKFITDTGNIIKINAIKSTNELIVASGDIKISIADNIEYIKLLGNISENSDIRIVFSTDKGETWYTYDGENIINTDCTIPMKMYSDMSDEEKVKYKVSKDIIADIGMTIEQFNSFNFNMIESYGIRFAYVITRPLYNDKSEVKELSWMFDAKGCMKELKDNEYDLDVYDHRVQLKSNVDNDLLKISIIT